MANATDSQMQHFADERIRPFAEALRMLLAKAQDHKTAIDDAYARATNGPLWSDARTDGPPHLLASGPGAVPDDLTNFNAFLTAFISFCTGSANVAGQSANYGVLLRACVQPLS